MPAPFFGKYRGVVTGADDPMRLGRLQVEVPEVLGEGRTSWAMPCVPFAGPGVGLFAQPPVGGHIWVEFEAGDPDYPIWTGCFWGTAEWPSTIPERGVSVLRVGDVALVARDQQEEKKPVLPGAASARAATEVRVSGPGLIVSRGGRAIVTVDDDQVAVTLGPLQAVMSLAKSTVTIGQNGSTVTVSADTIELSRAPHSVRVSTQGVDLKGAVTRVTLTPSKVEMGDGVGTVSVGTGQVKLSNGAASVALSPVTVNVNNGALEVI